MRPRPRVAPPAFTLTELLVTITVLAIFAALLFPALNKAKDRSRRTTCLNHLQQLSLGIRLYSDDSADAPPSPGSAAAKTNFISLYSAYKQLMKNYVGQQGTPTDKIFTCPADTFYPSFVDYYPTNFHWVRKPLHTHQILDYSSYAFNGGDNITRIVGETNLVAVDAPGLSGLKLSNVKQPARTILISDASALAPWSWHNPIWPDLRFGAATYNDARNMTAFVDGHVAYIKIYWNEALWRAKGPSFAMSYDPPAGYDYKWSGN